MAQERMMYSDTTRLGRPLAKDPFVINFGGKYLMYYSVPGNPNHADPLKHGWGIGIAQSSDLISWTKIAELTPDPTSPPEAKGLCAPSAIVIDGKVHLFYQTYGNQRKDAICHAVSTDGITFVRDRSNPIFAPTGDWNCGRAIDAEVVKFKNNYFLYFATRDPEYKIQIQGVAKANPNTDFSRGSWKLAADHSTLKPEFTWEGECVEGAALIVRGNRMVMFYAGGYNNAPQMIGIAESRDGVNWKRISNDPFLPNGKPGEWNSSESGHPHIFEDKDGRTYLFYQGNNDKGKTWWLTNQEILWDKKGNPYLKK